jgi:hypothetical protein
MAEPLRRDEQLTTADLAGRRDPARKEDMRPAPGELRDLDQPNRPKLVRNENPIERGEQKIANAADRTKQAIAPGAPHASGHDVNTSTPLFSETDIGDLRGRWGNVQAGFVDEPRRAVEEGDKLVATVMQRLAEGFANERSNLEKQWDRGDNVSTEDLRIALQRYRSFFDRLLNA